MTFYSKHHFLPIPKGSDRTRRKALLAAWMLLCIQPAATAQENADSVESHPELNYTATTGMALSIERFSFVVKVHYDNFRFNTGLQDENLNKLGDEYAMQKNRMKGRFFNWGVRADFQMKF